jgi:hypothetical protein
MRRCGNQRGRHGHAAAGHKFQVPVRGRGGPRCHRRAAAVDCSCKDGCADFGAGRRHDYLHGRDPEPLGCDRPGHDHVVDRQPERRRHESRWRRDLLLADDRRRRGLQLYLHRKLLRGRHLQRRRQRVGYGRRGRAGQRAGHRLGHDHRGPTLSRPGNQGRQDRGAA